MRRPGNRIFNGTKDGKSVGKIKNNDDIYN